MIAAAPEATATRPVGSPEEAERLIDHLMDVMDALLGVVQEETELVRVGKLGAAAQLESSKQELSRLYITDSSRLKASRPLLQRTMPGVLDALRRRHELFQAVLQVNLTVLATAHAVSESIMRGVSNELARKATPQGYGASGRAAVPSASGMQPLTVSRVL